MAFPGRAKHHAYTVAVIRMALSLVCGGGVSFRGASNVFMALNISRGVKVAGMVKGYFEQTLQKTPAAKLLLCSSYIIESCFGKYKEVVKMQ